MIARIGRRPHFPKPKTAGRWLYVELEFEISLSTHKELHTYRGWVDALGLGSRRFESWLTHELLTKVRAMARVQRHVRRTRDVSADYTSNLLSALSSVALSASA